MTQDERRLASFNEVMGFITTSHRNPSKHRIDNHMMLNFIKHNRKLLNAGNMKADRVEKFNELLGLGEKDRRGN